MLALLPLVLGLPIGSVLKVIRSVATKAAVLTRSEQVVAASSMLQVTGVADTVPSVATFITVNVHPCVPPPASGERMIAT